MSVIFREFRRNGGALARHTLDNDIYFIFSRRLLEWNLEKKSVVVVWTTNAENTIMLKLPVAGSLLGASRVSAKLFKPSNGLHVATALRLKESEFDCYLLIKVINCRFVFVVTTHLMLLFCFYDFQFRPTKSATSWSLKPSPYHRRERVNSFQTTINAVRCVISTWMSSTP